MITRDMQIKLQCDIIPHPLRWSSSKHGGEKMCGRDVEKSEPLWYAGNSIKKFNIEFHCNPAIPTLGEDLKEGTF